VVTAVGVLWFISHLKILEGRSAGHYLRTKKLIERIRVVALGALALTACALFFVGVFSQWTRDPEGRLLMMALLGLLFLLDRELDLRQRLIDQFEGGETAEARVRSLLEPLRDQGWRVVDDVVRDDGRGNVDHAVKGPRGAYAIETKSYRYRGADLSQAASNAVWLKHKWQERWVNAVLCVDDPGQPIVEKRVGNNSPVWVVDQRQLVDWLRAQATADSPSSIFTSA
jgi:hypothetical protein